MYAMPQYLNPQGSDLAKSLLTFAEGKPLGQAGWFWLAVHVANTFGNDKCSLEDRAQWTKDNFDRLVSMANDPLADRWWAEADKPFQFLAACIELIGVKEQARRTSARSRSWWTARATAFSTSPRCSAMRSAAARQPDPRREAERHLRRRRRCRSRSTSPTTRPTSTPLSGSPTASPASCASGR
jgi:hypothetical protein